MAKSSAGTKCNRWMRGLTSSLIEAHVTMPIVPCAPWITLTRSVCAGPIGFFCAAPTAHCCSSVPGPEAPPVRKKSPVPKTTSVQSNGSVMSQ